MIKLTENVSALDASPNFVKRLEQEFPKNKFYTEDIVKMKLKDRFDKYV